ncbi:cytochrome c3 family protein [Chloroflexota bacterium]
MKNRIVKSVKVFISSIFLSVISMMVIVITVAQISYALPGEFLNEAHYRIGDDTPLDDMVWLNTTDNRTSGILRNENFRVRFQVYNSGSEKEWLPRLEYLSSAGNWAGVPSTAGSAPFYIAATSQFTNGDNISISDFALGTGTGSPQEGRAYGTVPSTSINISASSYTEIEYNIRASSNALYYTPYLLRLSDNGVGFDSYANTAIISIWQDENTSSPHSNYVGTTGKCAACHRTHTATGKTLRSSWPEESLCLTCHDGTGARTDIAGQFEKTYTHPVDSTQGVHTTGEGSYNWLPATNRHVECEDCHNPHGSFTGSSTPGFDYLSRNIEKVWGISITNPTTEWAALSSNDYVRLSPITEEYQLCMKCHSSYAYSSSGPLSHGGGLTETDQAIEFNVNNDSYHWVEIDKTASSGNTPRTDDASRNMTFTPGSGMEKDSPLSCSSCHAGETDSEPRGPHGSSNAYLLKDTWSDTVTGTSYELCLQCHDPDVYGPGGSDDPDKTNFSGFFKGNSPAPNLHVYHFNQSSDVYGCQNCHSAVPHGGWNRALLVEMDDPAPYNNGSLLDIRNWPSSDGKWSFGFCGPSPCHIPGS